MSDWLTRFDNALVTHEELERIPHYLRVAWGYYVINAVVKNVSRYFVETSGLDHALHAAEQFISRHEINYALIRMAGELLNAKRLQLQSEGYDVAEFVISARLVSCIRGEKKIGTAIDGTLTHNQCKPECDETIAPCLMLQGDVGVFYVCVAQWVHGIGACKVPIEPLDDLQDHFFRFSRRVYEQLATAPPNPLPVDGLPGIELPWEIPEDVKEMMRRTQFMPPPTHERRA